MEWEGSRNAKVLVSRGLYTVEGMRKEEKRGRRSLKKYIKTERNRRKGGGER